MIKAFPSDVKRCKRCGADKPRGDFYRAPGAADGFDSKCKMCACAAARANYREHREQYREYERGRAALQRRVDARTRYARTEQGKRAVQRAKDAYRGRNPEKRKAHNAVTNAVRDGRLVKPAVCQRCGELRRLHGHHHDYSKPLSVIWLCATCHQQHHAMMRLIEKSMNREEGQPRVRADVLAREAKERRKVAKLARSQAHAGQTEMEG